MKKKNPEQLSENCYRVVVDYSRSLQQMIAAGNFYYVDPDINEENFPLVGSGIQEITVEDVHFGREIPTEDVLREFAARGIRPATLPEALARTEKRRYPLLVLGSVRQCRSGSCKVPYLDYWDVGCKLGLTWLGGKWRDYCRFAGVPTPT